jgi:pyruvate/2-oxoglutarate dehydrogenase complex dihydrolipoamide dehydrogenase (E3) component
MDSFSGGGVIVNVSEKWQILESCPLADEADWIRHVAGFATAFVVPAKRERWAEMLARRPRRIGQDSHKLHSDLDRRTCRRVVELPTLVHGDGLFYEFYDKPRVVPAANAIVAAGGNDAIFSLIPGKLAVYFFHEDELWLCQT